ncbi:MAG: amidohydrolase family protein [Pyrinomonadaceae bacterium]
MKGSLHTRLFLIAVLVLFPLLLVASRLISEVDVAAQTTCNGPKLNDEVAYIGKLDPYWLKGTEGIPDIRTNRSEKSSFTEGMTPMQAIQSATLVAADLLERPNDMGALEAGKYADIIAVTGDPLRDITELERVKFVMKGGKVERDDMGR